MKRSEIRGTIIQTASDLFYKNGYNLTGINEIIAEAGIAKATLYNHFDSKEDICIAYLQHKNDDFLKQVAAFCKAKPAGKDQLLGLFDFLMLFFQDKDFNGCWCMRTVSEIPRENENIRAGIQTEKKAFMALIERLVKENMDKNANLDLAKQLYLLYESAVAESHLHRADWPIKATRRIAELII